MLESTAPPRFRVGDIDLLMTGVSLLLLSYFFPSYNEVWPTNYIMIYKVYSLIIWYTHRLWEDSCYQVSWYQVTNKHIRGFPLSVFLMKLGQSPERLPGLVGLQHGDRMGLGFLQHGSGLWARVSRCTRWKPCESHRITSGSSCLLKQSQAEV